VYVNSNGQLGTQTSSLRFKEQIADMGDSTSALMKLRPVTFVYKPEYQNGDRTLQYGLIAEEVAQVYPELVAYDNDGQPYSVRYQYLTPMLLNEAQRQYRRAEAQAEVIKSQEQKIDSQQSQIEEMQQRLSRLEALIGARVNTARLDPEHHAISNGEAQ
jgi:DNA repair exonuclease SbcCD ATPase subunit